MIQLTIKGYLKQITPCTHKNCFATMAYVPAGLICEDCGTLLLQWLPQSPDELGYTSADWAWHYVHGKAWTTQEPKTHAESATNKGE